ncbi:MAG: hypothetical protein ACOC1F_01905 [Myxococcota bacterium]
MTDIRLRRGRSLVTATLCIAIPCIAPVGCGPELIRPRAAGEKVDDRPGKALVVGQFSVEVEGFEDESEIGITRHRVLVGDDDVLFTEQVPPGGRTFAVWVYPGVFCFGRPTLGTEGPPELLGKGPACAEIPEADRAYYVGSVAWRVVKKGSKVTATLEVDNRKESVMASRNLAGIYPETALVSESLDPEKVASKYEVP